MNRRREILEIITAVLLGLVSVATAFSAYQASVFAQEAADIASISQQLRDRNLTEALTSQLLLQDDSRRVVAAFALQSELVLRPDDAASVAAQQQALVAAASPELQVAWTAWAAADFSAELIPLGDPDYLVGLYAVPQSLQYASFVTDGMVDRLTAKAQSLTGAAVFFAVALFVLGVGGIVRSTAIATALASGGAALFLVGLIAMIAASV